MQAQPLNLPSLSTTTDYKRFIPFLKPAVKQGLCEVDNKALIVRSSIVMGLFMITVFGTTTYLEKYSRVFRAIPPLLTLTIPYDLWRADSVADVRAVNEYLNKELLPSESATQRIQGSFSAAQLLVEKKGDTNRINANGKRLIDQPNNYDVYRFLIDNTRCGICKLEELVMNPDPRYLNYFLQNRRIKLPDEETQVSYWLNVGCVQSAHYLKKHGFNINAKDQFGRTALHRLVEAQPHPLTNSHRIGWLQHIHILIHLGIDTNIRANYALIGYPNLCPLTAQEATPFQFIREFIQSYSKNPPAAPNPQGLQSQNENITQPQTTTSQPITPSDEKVPSEESKQNTK